MDRTDGYEPSDTGPTPVLRAIKTHTAICCRISIEVNATESISVNAGPIPASGPLWGYRVLFMPGWLTRLERVSEEHDNLVRLRDQAPYG